MEVSIDQVKKLIKKHTINGDIEWQAILDNILAKFPKESWEDVPGDTDTKRDMFIDGGKWKTTRWFIKIFVQEHICPKCGKIIGERFQLHHHDWSGSYYTYNIKRLQAIHFHCHHKEHGIKNKKVFETIHKKLKGTTKVTKRKNMKETDQFVSVVRELSKDTKEGNLERIRAKLGIKSKLVSVLISPLVYMGFVSSQQTRREGKKFSLIGINLNDEFENFSKLSDKRLEEYYDVWKKDAARPYPGLKLELQPNHDEVMVFERGRHPVITSLLYKDGFNSLALDKSRRQFVDKKLKTIETKKLLICEINELRNSTQVSDLESMSLEKLRKFKRELKSTKCKSEVPKPKFEVESFIDKVAQNIAETIQAKVLEKLGL